MMLFRVLLTAVLGVNPLKKLPFLLSSFGLAETSLLYGTSGIRAAVQQMPSMASAEREFAYRKLTIG